MGFTKDKAITEVRVDMLYKIVTDETGDLEEVSVSHLMRVPDLQEREDHSRESVKVKGRKITPITSKANWNLWKKIVTEVIGYDDLENPKDSYQLKSYFSDDGLRMHVDDAVQRLFEVIGAEDSEYEKKSEPSSEESSGEALT